MSVQVRPATADELEAVLQAISVPFGFDPSPARIERFVKTIEVPRLRVAIDGDQIVGTLGAFSLQMTVPGNVLATAGTTVITVLPTHRRRGVFRKLITEHLSEVHRHAESLSALWASESTIYGRFGYGPASERSSMKLDKPWARFRQPPDVRGTFRLVERDEALRVFPKISEEVASRRPGMFLRSDNWWAHRVLFDPEEAHAGSTAHRRLLHFRECRPVGYCLYRTRAVPDQPGMELKVLELVAADIDAEKAIWNYLLSVDLVTSISYWNQPVDDPLRWWIEEPRRMERKIQDSLWIRLIDVPTALEGRRYSSPGSLVLRLRDEICPWNNDIFRLDVDGDGRARCRPAKSDPQLELTPEALASVYFGGTRFHDLERAGIIRGTADALRRAEALFAWDRLPWCPELF